MENKIKITLAKPSDTNKIVQLEREVWKEAFGLDGVAGKYDVGSFIRLGLVFVAKDKNKIVGAIISFGTESKDMFIADWVVDKKYRNHGIGKELFNKLIKKLKNRKLITFIEERYKESIHFHKEMGFKTIKTVKDIYGIGEKQKYYVFEKIFK
ncbi:MAG: GNAT family N-acetyltransferase [Candidatus Staskawiczbacteria bacterium]|nr:GNAT family N-acetyltransferase [Candidatus Staskawiczbacteria bacterium]